MGCKDIAFCFEDRFGITYKISLPTNLFKGITFGSAITVHAATISGNAKRYILDINVFDNTVKVIDHNPVNFPKDDVYIMKRISANGSNSC